MRAIYPTDLETSDRYCKSEHNFQSILRQHEGECTKKTRLRSVALFGFHCCNYGDPV